MAAHAAGGAGGDASTAAAARAGDGAGAAAVSRGEKRALDELTGAFGAAVDSAIDGAFDDILGGVDGDSAELFAAMAAHAAPGAPGTETKPGEGDGEAPPGMGGAAGGALGPGDGPAPFVLPSTAPTDSGAAGDALQAQEDAELAAALEASRVSAGAAAAGGVGESKEAAASEGGGDSGALQPFPVVRIVDRVAGVPVAVQIIMLRDSAFVWVGAADAEPPLSTLSVAMPAPRSGSRAGGAAPVSTLVAGAENDTRRGEELARRVAERCRRPVCVSVNGGLPAIVDDPVEAVIVAALLKGPKVGARA